MDIIRRSFRPPKMLLRVYSLFILMCDLITLFAKINYEILIAIYGTICPPPQKKVFREVAVVVGGGHGIGKELAFLLSKWGVNVACIDTVDGHIIPDEYALGEIRPYICNITNKERLINTVASIQARFGDITMLFYCSIPSPASLLQNNPDPDVTHTINLTIISYFWLLEKILPSMKSKNKGHIVFLSSVAGLSSATTEHSSRVLLSAAQFAIQGLAESLHTELRHSNCDVIVTLVHIYPFIIDAESARDIRSRIPSFLGTMPAAEAAQKILDGVRRNYVEFSIPGYLLYLKHILRILPKSASFMLRDFLDTGVDFG
ncbi:17-beta-hydroxysteroid dehydrogenase 13 isoform X2 [Megalopta genalis]|uniref:17-beta-hydroxysteroid dehydrogenase 13 isoform X2 n=1 Tax=Megalopta genalis TaxID=115081 RepID=UPI00144345AA|nr:17-beta-hydroxysteroid dehydrogenase 13-like isoform X2 [Megalopta genalis]